MYYAEQMINGKLHYKLSPDAEWKPISRENLSERVLKSQKKIAELNELIEKLNIAISR